MNEVKQIIRARVVEGYRVASGLNGNPRFPGGTLRMQFPYFRQLGLDLSHLYLGTLNVSIAPARYRVVKPKHTFRGLKWHPAEPAEDFSFFDVSVLLPSAGKVDGLIYYPHPETKPEHFQAPDILELLLPFVAEIRYGRQIELEVPRDQMIFETISAANAEAAGLVKAAK